MTEPSDNEFYHGVLLAVREHRAEFDSYGPRFHQAFGVMITEAGKRWKMARWLIEHFDPVFGVHRAAEHMVLEGMVALLLVLESPRLVVARFKISRAQAAQELKELPDADVYRRLAVIFDRELQGC